MRKQDAWEQRLLEAEVIAPPSGELFSENQRQLSVATDAELGRGYGSCLVGDAEAREGVYMAGGSCMRP